MIEAPVGRLTPPTPEITALVDTLTPRGTRAIEVGRYDIAFEIFREMYERMLALQRDGIRFHKGLPLHSMGLVRLRVGLVADGLTFTALAFIEDSLSRAVESPESFDELARPAAVNLRLYGLGNELLPAARAIHSQFVLDGHAPLQPEFVYEKLELVRSIERIASAVPSDGSASLTSDILVEREYALPALQLGLDELQTYMSVLSAVAPNDFSISARHANAETTVPGADLDDILRHVPARAISKFRLSGSSLSGTRVVVEIHLDSSGPSTVKLVGRRENVGQIREFVEGDLLTRARSVWVSRLRTIPFVALASLAVASVVVIMGSLTAQRLFAYQRQFDVWALGATTATLLALSFALGIPGKLFPAVYVPNAGKYALLRAYSWRIAVSIVGIGTAAWITWLLTPVVT